MEVTNQQILDELAKRPSQVSNVLAAIAFGAVLFMAFWANGLNDNIPAEMRENRQEVNDSITEVRAECKADLRSQMLSMEDWKDTMETKLYVQRRDLDILKQKEGDQ